MWICLACLLRSGSWSVAMWEESIVLPFVSLYLISFEVITGDIVVVVCFDSCTFAPESTIAIVLLIGELVGV